MFLPFEHHKRNRSLTEQNFDFIYLGVKFISPHNIEKLSGFHAHVYYNIFVAITSDRIKIAQYQCKGVIFPMYGRTMTGKFAAENYSSLPQCGSSKRLQLQRQHLKSNDMAASEDGGGVAVAEALGRIILQQERGNKSIVGRRHEKIAAGAGWKHIGRRQENIAAGARRKLALSSVRASMLLSSKLRGGGRWYSNKGATLILPFALDGKGEERPAAHHQRSNGGSNPL